ncbi:unnamed protein product [Brassica napus]|uniref:(rape) hypothetical protein n=1 Tax=Brassica napus TaxID=3708 RepID=A0A816R542_BRANA|nr:unnamed protein product [Brassica napus]
MDITKYLRTAEGADARREACWILLEYEDSGRWTRDHCMDNNHTAGASRDANRPHGLHIWSRNVLNGLDPWRLVCSLVMAQEKLGRQSWLLLNIKETTWLQLLRDLHNLEKKYKRQPWWLLYFLSRFIQFYPFFSECF